MYLSDHYYLTPRCELDADFLQPDSILQGSFCAKKRLVTRLSKFELLGRKIKDNGSNRKRYCLVELDGRIER